MDAWRLTVGDVVVALGAVVLVVSLFLPWYSVSFDLAEFKLGNSASGREALGSIDFILFLLAAAAVAIVAARAVGGAPAPAILPALGALAVLLVLYRIIYIPVDGDVPDAVDLSLKAGVFIALVGAAAVTLGGWRIQNDRRRPEGRAAVSGLELRG